MKPIDVLFLSRNDIQGLGLSPDNVVPMVEAALREHSNETYEMKPKIGVHPTGTDPANFIHAMPAYLKEMKACGLKWVSGFSMNYKVDLPTISGVSIYNDIDTGVPLSIMDCAYLTGHRTACVSSVAARLCAREGAEVFALAGCGFQGSLHLQYITHQIPTIKEVRLTDFRIESAESLKQRASEFFKGEIKVCGTNEEAVGGADVISTCTFGTSPIIDAPYFKEGAFGVGIEGGCAYTAEALHMADKFIVDDIPLAKYFDEIGRNRLTPEGEPDPEFPGGMPEVHSSIGDILTGKNPGRESDAERIVATPIGLAICDLAVTKLIYDLAVEKGAGTKINLT